MRKIKLKEEEQPELVGVKKKTERREATRENKALRAAKLEKSIEKELLDRLKRGAYGEAPLNVNESVWNAVLESAQARVPDAEGNALELEEELSDEEQEEDIEAMDAEMRAMNDDDDEYGQREFVSDDEGSEDDDDLEDYDSLDEDSEDDTDDSDTKKSSKRPAPKRPRSDARCKRGRPRVEIEYEQETEPLTAEQLSQW